MLCITISSHDKFKLVASCVLNAVETSCLRLRHGWLISWQLFVYIISWWRKHCANVSMIVNNFGIVLYWRQYAVFIIWKMMISTLLLTFSLLKKIPLEIYQYAVGRQQIKILNRRDISMLCWCSCTIICWALTQEFFDSTSYRIMHTPPLTSVNYIS